MDRPILFLFLQASCDLNTGGSAGGSNENNTLCQLNQNFLNQYIFLILWFWFVALIVIGFLQLCFEIFTTIPKFRVLLIKWKLSPLADENTIKLDLIEGFLNDLEIGDWFLLYQISKNMSNLFFCEFIKTVSTSSQSEEVPLTDVEANTTEANPINSEDNSNIC
jgi:hypothetical protein